MPKPLLLACCLMGASLVGAAWWLWSSPVPEPDPRAEMCRRLAQECSVRKLQECQKQVRSVCARAVDENLLGVRN